MRLNLTETGINGGIGELVGGRKWFISFEEEEVVFDEGRR